MIERLSVTQRRAIAVGLLGLVLSVLYWVVAAPVLDRYRESGVALADLRKRLTGFQRVAAGREALKRQFDGVKGRVATQQRGYLKGKTRSLAAAEMQEHVKRMVESNGGRLNSIQIVQSARGKEQDPREPVTIKVQMTGSTTTAQKVFHALEAGQPRLFVGQVYLRGRTAYQVRPGQPQNDELDVRFSLMGYIAAAKT